MIEKTGRYLRSLRKENESIMVPTAVMTEYLQKFDADSRKAQLEVLQRYFFVPSFDVPSAYIAAELAHRHQEAVHPQSREPGERGFIKTDFQIIATAIANGAAIIITDEVEKFQKYAAGKIKISSVPDVPEQTELDLDDPIDSPEDD